MVVLVVTNSADATANYLIPFLDAAGIEVARVDTDRCVESTVFHYDTSTLELALPEGTYSPEDVSHVWYRRPEPLRHLDYEYSSQGKFALREWRDALEGFLAHIPFEKWMNHPSANAHASSKLLQLTTARRIGLKTPNTLVTNAPDQARTFCERYRGRVVSKPISHGYVEGAAPESDSIIYTSVVDDAAILELNAVSMCPTLFQERIHKTFDARLTLIGEDWHAVALQSPSQDSVCDVRRNNMAAIRYAVITPPKSVLDQLRRLVDGYRLRFSAIDMVVTHEGDWVFLENNPNGQWAWLDQVGVTSMHRSFLRSFGAR